MQTMFATRVFGAALACASFAALAQSEPVTVVLGNADASLVPVDAAGFNINTVSTIDPPIYRSWTGATLITGDAQSLQVGTALNFAGVGPQVRITGLGLFVKSRAALVQQRVQATVQLWENYQVIAPDKPVFYKAPPVGQITIDLVGPYILKADTLYRIDAVLPKPLLLSGYQNKGVVAQVLSTTGFGDPQPSSDLVPAYDTGNAAQSGTNLASYASDGSMAYNFRGDENTSQPLAIDLFGAAQKHVQCGNWTGGYRDQFIEEFDKQISPRWNYDLNGGTFNQSATPGGSLQLRQNGNFPYVRMPNPLAPVQVIPTSGQFSVRWLARYDASQPYGTATLALSRGLDGDGAGDRWDDAAMWVWQDSVQGYHIKVKSSGTPINPSPAFQEAAGAGTSVHDIEYCWLANTVELWVDGQKKLDIARSVTDPPPRPDSLWIGNHTTPGSGNWNDLTVFRIHVRKPNPADTIYFDGLE